MVDVVIPRYEFRIFGKCWMNMKAKERFGYMVNDTICEFAHVWINGAMVVTVNSESTEIDNIKKTIKDLGLEGVENINYMQAVKRVVGVFDKKLAN